MRAVITKSQNTDHNIIILKKFEISCELPNVTQRHGVSKYYCKNGTNILVNSWLSQTFYLQKKKKEYICKVQ